MNWWQYNPYSPPPPPHWGGGYQPGQQIPCPPGVDPLKVMEFMDRVQRRAAKAKEKETAKKPDAKKEHWKDLIWYFQAACVLYFLSAPIAALQHIISTIATTVIK